MGSCGMRKTTTWPQEKKQIGQAKRTKFQVMKIVKSDVGVGNATYLCVGITAWNRWLSQLHSVTEKARKERGIVWTITHTCIYCLTQTHKTDFDIVLLLLCILFSFSHFKNVKKKLKIQNTSNIRIILVWIHLKVNSRDSILAIFGIHIFRITLPPAGRYKHNTEKGRVSTKCHPSSVKRCEKERCGESRLCMSPSLGHSRARVKELNRIRQSPFLRPRGRRLGTSAAKTNAQSLGPSWK